MAKSLGTKSVQKYMNCNSPPEEFGVEWCGSILMHWTCPLISASYSSCEPFPHSPRLGNVLEHVTFLRRWIMVLRLDLDLYILHTGRLPRWEDSDGLLRVPPSHLRPHLKPSGHWTQSFG